MHLHAYEQTVRKAQISHLLPGCSQSGRFLFRRRNGDFIIVPKTAEGICFHLHDPYIRNFRLCPGFLPQRIQHAFPLHRNNGLPETFRDPVTHISVYTFQRNQIILFQPVSICVGNRTAQTNRRQIHILNPSVFIINGPNRVEIRIPVILKDFILIPVAARKLICAVREKTGNVFPLCKGQHTVALGCRITGKNSRYRFAVRYTTGIRQKPGQIPRFLQRKVLSFRTRDCHFHKGTYQQQNQQRHSQNNNGQLHPAASGSIFRSGRPVTAVTFSITMGTSHSR